MVDMAFLALPLPVPGIQYLLRHGWDNLARMNELSAALSTDNNNNNNNNNENNNKRREEEMIKMIILHGTADEIVPIGMGREVHRYAFVFFCFLSSFSTLLLPVSSDLPSDISLFFVLFLIFVFFLCSLCFFSCRLFIFLFVVVLHSVAKLASNNIWSLQYIEIPNGDHNQILNHAKDEIFDAMGVVEEM